MTETQREIRGAWHYTRQWLFALVMAFAGALLAHLAIRRSMAESLPILGLAAAIATIHVVKDLLREKTTGAGREGER